LNNLFIHFDALARGLIQVPSRPVVGAPDFVQSDKDIGCYHELLTAGLGTFYRHYLASVPFLLEQHCRLGVAVARYARATREGRGGRPLAYWETSSADGANGRALAAFGEGMIRTLSDSPNAPNEVSFRELVTSPHAAFYLGSFLDIDRDLLAGRVELAHLAGGFDVIHENITFQFYGPERLAPIGHLLRLLRPGGIVVLTEKLMNSDRTVYDRMEQVKDRIFKNSYFDSAAIDWKKREMLAIMEHGQVDQKTLTDGLRQYFDHVVLIWNSGNFYELVASSDPRALDLFVAGLVPPYVPDAFRLEPVFPIEV
jgi:SAM-dependent methyltransferase